jgi:hypothetical protein
MGTLLGMAFVAQDAVAYPASGSEPSEIVLTDFAKACTFGVTDLKANSNTIVFDFGNHPFAAGTYTTVLVQYAHFDAMCHSSSGESGGGMLTITNVDSMSVTGIFNLALNADQVTGSFTAGLLPRPPPTDAGGACR